MSLKVEFVKFLGKGSYGSVDLFRYIQNDGSMLYTAVKSSRDSLVGEFEILLELRGCPRIVQLLEKDMLEREDSDGNRVYMMPMEYASEGSLSDFMHRTQQEGRLMSDYVIREFTRMILQGLVSIHRHGYVHCDLKPDNLLVFSRYDQETRDYSYELKISHLGLAIKAGGISPCWQLDSPFVGTPNYMSPDSVHDGSVQKALDLWSLGCIVLDMFTGERPWSEVSSLIGLKRVLGEECKAPEVPEYLPCEARQFLHKCFALNPLERGRASELLLHPFLIGDDDDKKVVEKRRVQPERFEDIVVITKKNPSPAHVPEKPLNLKVMSPPPKSQLFKKISIMCTLAMVTVLCIILWQVIISC